MFLRAVLPADTVKQQKYWQTYRNFFDDLHAFGENYRTVRAFSAAGVANCPRWAATHKATSSPLKSCVKNVSFYFFKVTVKCRPTRVNLPKKEILQAPDVPSLRKARHMSPKPETITRIGYALERGRDRGYRVPTDRDRSGGDRDRPGRTVIINNKPITWVVEAR